MTFAFPAFHEMVLERAHTVESIEAAMRRSGWNRIEQTPTGMRGAVPFNVWSFGEKVEVTCDGSRTVLRSSCVWPTQCLDWGKNRRNLEKLAAALEP